MEPFALMLWIIVAPLHAYILQPSTDVVAIEDSWVEGTSWNEDGKEEPLLSAVDQESHGEGGTEQEAHPRAEAREVEVEERYDADKENRVDDREGKWHEGDRREQEMEERRSADEDEKEIMLTVVLEEGEKEGVNRDDFNKEKGEEYENEEDERQGDEKGKDKNQEGEEMVGDVNWNQREYTVEDGREETERIYSPPIGTDNPHLTLSAGLSTETISDWRPNPLSIETEVLHLSSNPRPSIATDILHLNLNSGLSNETDIPHFTLNTSLSIETINDLSPNPPLSIETDISHLSTNPSPTIAADILHLSQNSGVSKGTDIPHSTLNPGLSIKTISDLNPNPLLSIETDIPHLSPNHSPSIAPDIPHWSPNSDLSKEADIPHLTLNPGLPIETISDLSPNPLLPIETDIHLSPNIDLYKEIDIPNFSSNPGLSIEIELPKLSPNYVETNTSHISPNSALSLDTDSSYFSPDHNHSVEADISHMSPNPGVFMETDTSHLNPTPSPDYYVDQNSSLSHQGLDPFQTLLPIANSTLTPTVSQGPEREEPAFTAVKPISTLVQLWNLTDSSQPRLREEEGLASPVTEVIVDSSLRDLTNVNTQKPQRSEKKSSRVNLPMPKPKKKKQNSKNTETMGKKQQNKVKAEEKNKSLKKDKNKKNKKRKQKENKKTEKKPNFPYFKDHYCPPNCACYGRVVQCSDKVLNKVPYGIPYNARYVLLMNNQISGIELDLLREYTSLEFLVLSNNLLTDGGIEGAFEGMRHLKRLYLDRNHLESISTDLPLSLEELRLDSNNVSVMSAVAWASCPSLQVLNLNNNSLGGDSVPDGVFTPLIRLRTLSFMYNLLTTVPVHLPTNLKELYLRGNYIDQIPSDTFTKGSELLILDLSANLLTNKGLTKASLQPLADLESLNLEGNLLKNIPQHLPPTLRTLSLEGNGITTVNKAAFLKLPHLEHLALSRNQITRVAPGAFWGLPALHQLELGHNVLRQVPRRLPPSLNSVSLVHNKISSIPRDSFCTKGKDSPLSNLVRVHLEHNLIDLAELDSQAFSCLRGYQVIDFH